MFISENNQKFGQKDNVWNNQFIVYTIYLIINLKNGKKYVGYTKWKPEERWRTHRYISNSPDDSHNEPVHKAIAKYGIENFNFEVISQSKDGIYLHEIMETYFIKLYNTCRYNKNAHGYNLTEGGSGSGSRRVSKRRKINSSNKLKGRKQSEHQIRNSALARTGIKQTPEHIENKTRAQRGQKRPKISGELHGACRTQRNTYEIKFIDGHIEIIVGLNKYCRDNNYRIDMLCGIRKGTREYHKDIVGMRLLYNSKGEFINEPYKIFIRKKPDQSCKRQKYKITFQDGHIEIIVGLLKFCKERGYAQNALYKVRVGKYKYHKDIIAIKLL